MLVNDPPVALCPTRGGQMNRPDRYRNSNYQMGMPTIDSLVPGLIDMHARFLRPQCGWTCDMILRDTVNLVLDVDCGMLSINVTIRWCATIGSGWWYLILFNNIDFVQILQCFARFIFMFQTASKFKFNFKIWLTQSCNIIYAIRNDTILIFSYF